MISSAPLRRSLKDCGLFPPGGRRTGPRWIAAVEEMVSTGVDPYTMGIEYNRTDQEIGVAANIKKREN
jgi:hypothetical protein